MKNSLDPEMIRRQVILIKDNFKNYPSSEEDTNDRVQQALDSGIWPLVNHVSLFDYPKEFSGGVIKLCNFPVDVEEKDKWLNEFAFRVNKGRVPYWYVFTEEKARSMNSDLGEIFNALNALKDALPFVHINVVDSVESREITFTAMDKILEGRNLVASIGDS